MNWLKSVADAGNVDALLGAVNEYLLQQQDDFWSWIPRDCRPKLVGSEEDLHHWHRRLAEQVATITSPNVRLQDLCVLFLRAAARAHELRDAGLGGASNDRQFRNQGHL